jgi:hypothetical protein
MARKAVDRDDDNEAQFDELGDDPGQVGAESAGQSGDSQGMSDIAESADESIEELSDTEQDYEAEVILGVEDAGDHPERPVRSHQDPRPANEPRRERDWE